MTNYPNGLASFGIPIVGNGMGQGSPNGRVWFVDTINGSNGYNGRSPSFAIQGGNGPFATMAKALSMADSYDTIVLSGVVREQLVAPLGVFDVSIIGAANQPRQATSGGVPTGGGSTWLAPTSPTANTPLLELIEQGWKVQNIMFGAVQNTPSIKLTRAEDAVHPDPSHAQILGCYFQPGGVTGAIGIQDSGGCFHNVIAGNLFYGMATAIQGIAGAGIAVPQLNRIENNQFRECTNDIDWIQAYGLIQNNVHMNTTTKKVFIFGTGGAQNQVLNEYTGVATAGYAIAGGFKGNATDIWRVIVTDSAAVLVAQPA